MATIMDGRPVAQQILARGAERVQAIVARTGVQPCLATVLVGDDPASVTYARMKRNRCESVGMRSVKVELPTASTTAEVVEAVAALGRDAAIHGILVQHPVPRHVDERTVFESIPAAKDVDGLTLASFAGGELRAARGRLCFVHAGRDPSPAGLLRGRAVGQAGGGDRPEPHPR
jgi:methylenetetrahydrofolate dehydrogenase (NADP+)/methenyltetrahydrofolate cyclohydrolase